MSHTKSKETVGLEEGKGFAFYLCHLKYLNSIIKIHLAKEGSKISLEVLGHSNTYLENAV